MSATLNLITTRHQTETDRSRPERVGSEGEQEKIDFGRPEKGKPSGCDTIR